MVFCFEIIMRQKTNFTQRPQRFTPSSQNVECFSLDLCALCIFSPCTLREYFLLFRNYIIQYSNQLHRIDGFNRIHFGCFPGWYKTRYDTNRAGYENTYHHINKGKGHLCVGCQTNGDGNCKDDKQSGQAAK